MSFEKYLPCSFCSWIDEYGKDASDITICLNKMMYISVMGRIIDSPYYVSSEIFNSILNKMCNGSIYANQHTLKQGYLTLKDGHRVGVSGNMVKNEAGNSYMREITALNIRISRNIPDAAKSVESHILHGRYIYNTLIIAPPSAGKTTLLKDIALKLGNNFRTGIVDERGEFDGIKSNSGHIFTIEGATKHEGILSLLRSMAPEIIITDEVGTEEDENAIFTLINAGVKIICTAHGYDERDIMRRQVFRKLINDRVFEKLIVLSQRNGPCTIEKIIDTREMINVDKNIRNDSGYDIINFDRNYDGKRA